MSKSPLSRMDAPASRIEPAGQERLVLRLQRFGRVLPSFAETSKTTALFAGQSGCQRGARYGCEPQAASSTSMSAEALRRRTRGPRDLRRGAPTVRADGPSTTRWGRSYSERIWRADCVCWPRIDGPRGELPVSGALPQVARLLLINLHRAIATTKRRAVVVERFLTRRGPSGRVQGGRFDSYLRRRLGRSQVVDDVGRLKK